MSDSWEERFDDLEDRLSIQAESLDAAFLLVCSVFVFCELAHTSPTYSSFLFGVCSSPQRRLIA